MTKQCIFRVTFLVFPSSECNSNSLLSLSCYLHILYISCQKLVFKTSLYYIIRRRRTMVVGQRAGPTTFISRLYRRDSCPNFANIGFLSIEWKGMEQWYSCLLCFVRPCNFKSLFLYVFLIQYLMEGHSIEWKGMEQ